MNRAAVTSFFLIPTCNDNMFFFTGAMGGNFNNLNGSKEIKITVQFFKNETLSLQLFSLFFVKDIHVYYTMRQRQLQRVGKETRSIVQ